MLTLTLSTHADTGQDRRARGPPRTRHDGAGRAADVTDSDGRLRDWVSEEQWYAGTYRLVFDTPRVAVLPGAERRLLGGASRHHHALLLSPYGY
jgi:hypothetical protein